MAKKIIGSLTEVMNNPELKAIQDVLDGLSLESRADYFGNAKSRNQIEAYKKMVRTGHDINNLRRSLGDYADAAAKWGFTNVQVYETGEIGANGTKTFKIIFYPTVMEDGLVDDDCPYLTISTRDGLGVGIDNHVPSMERLVAVRSGSMVGLASADAVSIEQAAHKLNALFESARFNKTNGMREKARLMKNTTSNAIRNVTRANPMINSGRAASEHQAAFNITDQRVESIAAISGQIDWSYLFSTLYDHRTGAARTDRNAPRSATEFNRLINKIIQDARGVESFDKFENIVKSKPEYRYIYDHFWKNGLESAFSQIFAVGLVQGTATEGASDLTSFFNVEIPGMPLVEKSSRKPAQNMRIRPPKNIPGRSVNITHTSAQKAFRGDSGSGLFGGNLYYGGYITDKNLAAAYERFVKENTESKLAGKDAYDMKNEELLALFKKNPFLGDFRRGINLDASVYDSALIHDFRETYSRTIEVTKKEYDQEVEKIKRSLVESGKSLTEEQIRLKALGSLADLRPGESLGKIFDDFDTDGVATITTKGVLKNPTFKALGGGTSDFRSVLAPMMSKLLGYAFENAGYRAEDIYNADGTLKMQFARQTEAKLEPKRFFNQAMGMYYYMVDQMRKSGKSDAEIEDIFNSGLGVGRTKKGARHPSRLLTADPAGGLLFNNESRVFRDPVAFLEGLAKIGQDQGIYARSQGDYTGNIFERTEDGGLMQRILTPIATEIGRTTILPWEGTQNKSRLHYGYRELHSFRNSLGLMRAMGIDTTRGEGEISSLLGTIEANENPQYTAYRGNVENMRKYTFNPDSVANLKNFKDNLGLVLSFDDERDVADIFSKISNDKISYNKDGTVVADDAYLNSPAYLIAEKKREYYQSLLSKYGADYLAKKGIISAESVPTAIDMGIHSITHDGMSGNLVVLPSGIAGVPDEYGSAEYDDLSRLTSEIVRGLVDTNSASPADAAAAALGGKIVAEAQQEAAQAILHKEGSLYKKFKQVEVGDSAYFMTQGLSSELFDDSSNAYDPRYQGNVVMNSKDYLDLLLRDNTDDGAEDLRNKLYAKFQNLAGFDLYEQISKGKRKENFDKLSVQQQNRIIAREIARYATIEDKRFKGAVTGSLFNRFPTIRGTNDILSAGVILTKNDKLVSRGNIAVDPFLSLEAKQDNDADRIGLTSGLSYRGGLTKEEYLAIEKEAAQRKVYFDRLVEKQRALGAKKFITAQEAVAIDDLNKLSNPAHQLAQAQLVNSGKALTGLYGDLLDGVNEALYRAGLTNSSISGINDVGGIETGLQSQMLGNLLATAHQEAISSKKIEEDAEKNGVDFSALSIEEQAKYIIERFEKLRSFNELMRTGSTYASRKSMEAMIDEGIRKGIFEGEDNLFKHNVLAGVMPTSGAGLNFLAKLKGISTKGIKDEDLLSQLLKSGISKENFLDMIYGNESLGITGLQNKIGKREEFTKKGINNLGDIINRLYQFIPGKGIGGQYVNAGVVPDSIMADRLRALGIFVPESNQTNIRDANFSLLDWGRLSIASRESKYKNALKHGYGYASPHTMQNVFPDLYGADISPVAQSLLKEIDDATDEQLASEEFKKKFSLEGENKDIFKTLKSRLSGELTHAIAEFSAGVFVDAGVGGWDEAQITSELQKYKENPDIQRSTRQLRKLLLAAGLKNNDIDIQLNNASAQALAHVAFLEKLNSDDIIGSEVALGGKHGSFETSGFADLLYKETLDNGETIVRVLDYKNTLGGNITGRDLAQVLHYIEDLQVIQDDIRAHSTMSAEDYFNNDNNIVAKRLRNTVQYLAKGKEERATERGEDFDKNSWIERQYRVLINLIDTLRNENTRIAGSLSYAGAGGIQRLFDINPDNVVLKGLIAKYDAGEKLTEENINEAIAAVKEKSRERVSGYVSTVETDKFKEFVGLLRERLELENNIYILKERESRLRDRNRTGEADDVAVEISAKEKELERIKESEKTAQEAVAAENKESYPDYIRGVVEEEQKAIIDATEGALQAKALANIADQNEEFIKEDEKEYVKTYKSGMPLLTKATIRKNEIERILGDESAVESSAEKRELERELKELNRILDATIKDSLARKIEDIEKYFKSDVATGFGKDAFGEIKDVRSDFDDAVARDKALGDAEYKRAKYLKSRQQYSEVYNAVSGLSGAEYRVWEIDQRISQESNKKTRGYLIAEREALAELVADAEARVEALKAAHTDKDGKLDPRYESLFVSATKRAELEASVKKEAHMAKTDGGAGGGGLFGSLGNQFSMYLRRFTGGMAIMRAIAKIRQEVQKLVSQAKELDKVMTNVRIVTNGSKEDTRNLISEYSDLAKQLGVTTKEVAQSGIEWMRQGYEAAEATKLITASLYLSKLGMIDSTTATKSLTSALKGFKLEAAEAMTVVDKLTAIDLRAATSAGDIAEGLAQFANLGSLSGVDIDQAAAYVATIADVTQRGGSSAGQALKTIISRFGNVKAGAYNELNVETDNSEASENLNDVERVLNKIGISIRDTNLHFKDFDEVLADIADKWESLDNVSKKAIANAFAGVRQQEAFVTLLENWDKYEDLLDTSRNSKGTAERKYTSYRESLEAATSNLQATIEDFVNRAEISELLIQLTNIATHLAKLVPFLVKFLPHALITLDNFKIFSGNNLLSRAVNSKYGQKVIGYFGDAHKQAIGAGYSKGAAGFAAVRGGIRGILTGNSDLSLGSDGYVLRAQRYFEEKQVGSAQNKYDDAVVRYRSAIGRYGAARRYRRKGEEEEALRQMKEAKGEYSFKKERLFTKKDRLSATNQKIDAIQNGSKQVGADKNTVLSKAKQVVSYAEETSRHMKEVANSAKSAADSLKQGEKDVEQQVVAEKEKTTEGKKGKVLARQATKEDEKQLYFEEQQTINDKNQASGGSTGASGMLGGKGSIITAGASYAVNQIMSGVYTYMTAGTTHKSAATGEDVESSEEAKKTGKIVAAAFDTAIPYVGKLVGELVSNAWMKSIDKERDIIKNISSVASKELDALSGLNSDFNTIKKSSLSLDLENQEELRDSINSYLDAMYTSENTDLRLKITSYLEEIKGDLELNVGEMTSLNDLLSGYESASVEDRKKIVRALEISQKMAERDAMRRKSVSEGYEISQRSKDALVNYKKSGAANGYYDHNGLTAKQGAEVAGESVGTGLGVGGGVMLGTAATMAALAGGFSSIPGPGWVIAAILAAGAGIAAGVGAADASIKRKQAEAEWTGLSTQKKIDSLVDRKNAIKEQIDATKEQIDTSKDNTKKIAKKIAKLTDQMQTTDEYLSALKDQLAFEAKEIEKENRSTMEIGLLSANVNGEYLTDMTTQQLEALHGQEILEALEKEVVGEFIGFSTRVNGEGSAFTDSFLKMATSVLKTDEEIAARLRGDNYTLAEAVDKLKINDVIERDQLQNFATALGVSVDKLGDKVESFGMLKLSELLQGPAELTETFGKYGDLLSSIADGSSSVSAWMDNIIKQFPDLIQYMGDTPKLMEAIIKKGKELSDWYINTQYESFAESPEYYKVVKERLLASELLKGVEGVEDFLNKYAGGTLAGLSKALLRTDLPEMATVIEKINTAIESGEILTEELVSDIYKDQLQKYIDFRVSEQDREIENLTAQRDAMQEITSQREYELKLVKARIALEEAQTEKVRTYRAGVGWVYEADQEKIAEKQKELEEIEKEKDISLLTRQIDLLTSMRDDWSQMIEKLTYENTEDEMAAFQQTYGILSDEERGLYSIYDALTKKDGGLLGGIKTILEEVFLKKKKHTEEQKELLLNGGTRNENGEKEKKDNLVDLWDKYAELSLDENSSIADRNAAGQTFYSASKDFINNYGGTVDEINQAIGTEKKVRNLSAADVVRASSFTDIQEVPDYSGTRFGVIHNSEPGNVSFDMEITGEQLSYEMNTKYLDNIWGDMGVKNKEMDKQRALVYNINLDESHENIKSIDNPKTVAEAIASKIIPTPDYKNDENLSDYISHHRDELQNKYFIIVGWRGDNEAVFVANGNMYKTNIEPDEKSIIENTKTRFGTNAFGSRNWLPKEDSADSAFMFENGKKDGTLDLTQTDVVPTLINELGTEAIITPYGTLTALPSHSGIIPADITKNLWELGGVAPSILRALSQNIITPPVSSSNIFNGDSGDSISINNLTMNVEADDSFDAEAFVRSIKEQAALIRNLR